MGWCIVVMELPRFFCPQIQSFALHSIMKAVKDLLGVLLCDALALWCILMMYHSTGIKENGQHDLDIAADLLCFFWPRGCLMFPLWRLHLHFWVVPINPCLITMFRKLGSLSALPSISCALSLQHCFCSILSSFGTNLANTLLMCKSPVKIECTGTDPMFTPNSIAISQTVIRWSCMIVVWTCSITLSFWLVEGLPERSLLSTDVWPFLKWLYPFFICEVLMASSLKACWILRMVSIGVSPRL
jgi:hypothetical protein